ncbi:NAD(P)-dependent dehydrogenase (short-subunit alcohol dehydrogenase family) [Natronospira proteinivora]|uniref:NAD(P)-dependent dehydrogenase (Short-subunit alcohol dehydrogenase family) n=1 Tax=Natronospira proteinivora TaxID=1807133 RepID=A0ABT1G844_9GAMM|nr:SDR family NAD(P)-dependent oxidoreductase [Natronospira proteinivora]MCP1727476.1 NAD(P)-dependent dehydrogenase (short-subunit alcohol dehydrogenase family) [Natronospira proteinivora]
MQNDKAMVPSASGESRPSVLITGCSSGIGEAAAHLLKDRGWRVFATARRTLDVHRLERAGFEALQLDLNDSLSITVAVDQVMEATNGHIDALVNNGAFAIPGAVEDLSRAAMRAQFEANVFGTMELTNKILPLMRDQGPRGQGRIIMISSILGLVAMPWRGAYNASKFALEGFTDTLRMELSETDIRVVSINPGPVESRFRHSALSNARRYIKLRDSIHAEQYARLERENTAPNGKLPGSVTPDAVMRRLLKALESPRPKPRYYVTRPAYVLAFLRRLLPTAWLDRILRKL